MLATQNKEQKYIIPTAPKLACRVQQGSILCPPFFNINICDLFFEKYECDIASYADDNTPHTYDSDLYTVLSKLKNCTRGWKKIILNQMVISATSLLQLKHQLVSTLTEAM